MTYKVGIKILPYHRFFRYYKVINHYFEMDTNFFVLVLPTEEKLFFPAGRIVVKLTKSWFDKQSKEIFEQVGQHVYIEPRS